MLFNESLAKEADGGKHNFQFNKKEARRDALESMLNTKEGVAAECRILEMQASGTNSCAASVRKTLRI